MAKTLVKLSAALASIVWTAGAALAQTTPFIELPHGGPYKGSAPVAPAMSLKDVPLHPAEASGQVPKLTLTTPGGSVAHIMPTPRVAAARLQAIGAVRGGPGIPKSNVAKSNLAGGPLVYHAGGSVMLPYVAVYNIYWAPPTLQDGTATGFSSLYGTVTILHNAWLPGHGLLNIATEYWQTINGTTTYINNGGGLGGFVVDNGAYPASGCNDSVTPGNCITDAQIQAKLTAIMNAQGWTGGMNKIFVLYTSSGEGSCVNGVCAYTTYCGYNSFFSLNGQNVIYTVIPYGNPTFCQVAGQTTPNEAFADLAANMTGYSMMLAATNPLFNAWFDSNGNDIGYLCYFTFGTNTWGSGTTAGNQMWNGWIFEDQQQFDNHALALGMGTPTGCGTTRL
jgi:hypothetical protein